MEKIIEIYWNDLTPKTKQSIADLINIPVDEVGYNTNWDALPMASIPFCLEDEDIKEYCTQNDGDCTTCSLTNYGRDCKNFPLIKNPYLKEEE